MLPHFVWADFRDVIADMNAHGFAFEPEWFRPHWEFRFPLIGKVQYDGVGIELRQALEPWHVMGEEGAAGGTVRFVDCSVERLEVKATRPDAGPPQDSGQWPQPCRCTPTAHERGGRRRALQGLAAAHGAASDHPAPCAADLRNLGRLARALAGRLHLSCRPSGRAQITRLSRSTPMRPRAAGSRDSSRSASPAGFSRRRPMTRAIPNFPYTLDLRRSLTESIRSRP